MTGRTVVSDLSDLLKILDPEREFPERAISAWLASYYEANHSFPCKPAQSQHELGFYLSLTAICQDYGVSLDNFLPPPRDLRELEGTLHFRIKDKYLAITEDEHGTQTSRRDLRHRSHRHQ